MRVAIVWSSPPSVQYLRDELPDGKPEQSDASGPDKRKAGPEAGSRKKGGRSARSAPGDSQGFLLDTSV